MIAVMESRFVLPARICVLCRSRCLFRRVLGANADGREGNTLMTDRPNHGLRAAQNADARAKGGAGLLEARHPQVGFFTEAAQTVPEYDPPHDGPCLVCWQPLHAEDVRTISLMPAVRGVASVFFRVHRTCAENDPGAVLEIEHRIIEGEFVASDKEWL